MSSYTSLKGIGNITDRQLTEALLENVTAFFDWGLLNANAFINVPVTTPGTDDPYADETLTMVHAEEYTDGQLWEAPHANWIWEQSVNVNVPPVNATGVYVSGTFHATASTVGAFAHYINFPAGRVVFTTPIATNSLVQCAYSYRSVNIYDNTVPWFRDVVFDAYLIDSQPVGDGFVKLLNVNSIRLPAIIIEPVMNRRLRGYELGGGQWIVQDFLFHILAESSADRNNLMDIITLQKDKVFFLFDVNARRRANDYALDWRGYPISNSKQYPDLLLMPPDGYRWKQCFVKEVAGEDVSLKLPLYRGIVRVSFEIDFAGM